MELFLFTMHQLAFSSPAGQEEEEQFLRAVAARAQTHPAAKLVEYIRPQPAQVAVAPELCLC